MEKDAERMNAIPLFHQWVNALGENFAGVLGATRYRLVDGEWRDPKMTRAEELMAKQGLPFKVRLRNGRYEAWSRE